LNSQRKAIAWSTKAQCDRSCPYIKNRLSGNGRKRMLESSKHTGAGKE